MFHAWDFVWLYKCPSQTLHVWWRAIFTLHLRSKCWEKTSRMKWSVIFGRWAAGGSLYAWTTIHTKFNNLGLSYYKFTSRWETHNSTRFLSLVCFCGNVKKFSSCWGLSSCIQGSCFTILEMMMLMVSSDRSSGFCRCFNSIGRLIRQWSDN